MHISFSQKDSLYKIFKILKKVPPYKEVTISIEKNHELFKHKRRAQQLTELINQHHIKATFHSKDSTQTEYFLWAGLSIVNNEKKWIRGVIDQAKKRLFSKKSVHRQLLAKKNIPWYLIVWSEIAVLIVPAWTWMSTRSEIHDQISIPYSIGTMEYNREMTIDVDDITYTYEQAHGQIEFINTLSDPISLVWWTQVSTTGWVIFTLDKWINIPAWTDTRPGRIRSNVTAREFRDDWTAIWEDWNIELWTTLLIKNLDASSKEQKVYAIAKRWFNDGKTIWKWTIIQEDIESIEQTILESMKSNKRTHLQEQFTDQENFIILPFDDLISFTVDEFISTATVWDSATFVDWVVNSTLEYAYITVDDFFDAVETYIKQRPLQGKFLIDYDPHSIAFYQRRPENNNPEYFSIPVKVNTIRWYNFFEDTYDLGKEMINNVKDLSRRNAKEILLEYEEVRDVTVKLSPPRYDTLPSDPNRIKVNHTIKNW